MHQPEKNGVLFYWSTQYCLLALCNATYYVQDCHFKLCTTIIERTEIGSSTPLVHYLLLKGDVSIAVALEIMTSWRPTSPLGVAVGHRFLVPETAPYISNGCSQRRDSNTEIKRLHRNRFSASVPYRCCLSDNGQFFYRCSRCQFHTSRHVWRHPLWIAAPYCSYCE